MALTWPFKDPDEVLDYQLNWAARLTGGDTIATSAWSVVGGDGELEIDSESNTTTATIAWLSGGTVGETYELLNRITTAAGRTMDQTMKIKIKAK